MIPSRDGAARLPETLRSIATQETPATVQVVLVDDGSIDATSTVARSASTPWGAIEVVRHETARGRAAARNAGVERAHAPVIVTLDDDITLAAGALEAHRRFHVANPGSAALGRVVLAAPERNTPFARFQRREELRREALLLAQRERVPFEHCLSGHLSCDAAALRAAGGFDARVVRYGFEDVELGFRLERARVRLAYLPEAESVHRAYVTDFERDLARHAETGHVARQLADVHQDPAFRAYLRIDAPNRLGLGEAPLGLVGLRAANRLLLRRTPRRILGSPWVLPALRFGLRVGERLNADRPVHFGYHVLRDLFYFQGYFGERATAAE